MVMTWKLKRPKGAPKDMIMPTLTAFKEFHLKNGEVVGIFQGSKGKNKNLDIVVKYKDRYTKPKYIRTPKHIHWVIDLLIKKEHNRELTCEFIRYLLEMYDKIEPFKNKQEQQDCKIKFTTTENLKKFDELNKHGQYSVEFIGHIIELLSIEEKTSMNGAFMFKGVLKALSEADDIFSIVSAATHNGRI